jgi:primase-polymerase (primpol)-like protein
MLTASDNGKQQKKSIPVAFHNYRQFISVKLIKKTDKIPCDALGRKIDAHDPKNWITVDEALARPFSVGFVFTSSDPFWFIDLDNAITENNKLSDLAQQTLDRFPGAAWEISTSGTGIHIFGSGRAPEHKSVRSLPTGKVEFYDWGRFVLIPPGDVYGDASLDFTPHLAAFVSD